MGDLRQVGYALAVIGWVTCARATEALAAKVLARPMTITFTPLEVGDMVVFSREQTIDAEFTDDSGEWSGGSHLTRECEYVLALTETEPSSQVY